MVVVGNSFLRVSGGCVDWDFWHAGQLEINAVMSAVIPGQNTEVWARGACKVSRQSWHMLVGMTI